MDTLFDDLQNLLSRYFDVSATVFLTDKQLELEDANASVYEQENWPWILTNIKFHFIPTEACARDGDKHRIFEFIDEIINPINLLPCINSIYKYAHLYNQKELIKKYSGRKTGEYTDVGAIYYAIIGGHLDLLSGRIHDMSSHEEFITAAFASGNHEIINMLNLDQHNVSYWIDHALEGAIEYNHIDLLKDLIEKYGHHIDPDSLDNIISGTGIGPNVYDTLVWLYESKLVDIADGYFLIRLLEDVVMLNGQLRLFQWIVDRFSNLINETNKYMILVKALTWGRLDCALSLMDEATILSSLLENDRLAINQNLVEYGYRKLYNKLIQN